MRTAALLLLVALTLLLLWRGADLRAPAVDDSAAPSAAEPEIGTTRATPGVSPERDVPSLRGARGAAGAGPVEVLIRTERGAPLGDVWVEAFAGPTVLAEAPADETGRALLPDLPYDGSIRVRIRHTKRARHPLPMHYGESGYPRIRGPRLDYTALGEVEFRLQIVDGWSGVPLSCSVELSPRDVNLRSEPRRDGSELSWTLLVPPGRHESFALRIDPPPGYVRWLELGLKIRPAPETRTATYLYPLRREALLFLDGVNDTEGEPCGDDTWCGVRFGENHWRQAEPERSGRDGRRLWGLPFFPGQRIHIHLENEAGTLRWITDAQLPREPWLPLRVTMPPPETDFRDPSSASPPPVRQDIERAPRTALLQATVRHHDGRPAPHVLVTAARGRDEIQGRTDVSGRVRLRVPAGDLEVRATGSGFLPVCLPASLAVGETFRLALDEPIGGRLTVEVVDDRGQPCSYANVWLSAAWVDLEDGIQRVDHWTDVDGTRAWPRVAAGEVGYLLRWAGHREEGVVEVENGGDHRLRLVLDEE